MNKNKNPDLQVVWWRLSLRVLWGVWLGCCIVYTRDTWAAYVLAVAFGILLGLGWYGQDLWHRRADDAIADQIRLLEFYNERAKAELETVIEQFFEGSPIQNYVIQVGDKGLAIKIGDDECLVPVDVQKLGTDPMAALEQAQLEWMSAKTRSED